MKSQRVDSGHERGAPGPRRSRRKTAIATATATAPVSAEVPAETSNAATEPTLDPLHPAEFCREVVARGSVEAACLARGITLEEYAQARLTDEAFDAAALMADQILDLRIMDQVRKAAQQEGGLASQTLYFRAGRMEAVQPPFPSLLRPRPRPGLAEAPTLPPEVAAAIIKAGLEAHEKSQQDANVT
jgi:hypothetical protein